jgi:hypothetical protein
VDLLNVLLFIAALLIGMAYGIALVKRNIFPHEYIKAAIAAYHKAFTPPPPKKYGPFAIGIYQGDSPFSLGDPNEGIRNPVLKAQDIEDMDALFVADPFIMRHDGKWLMFLEALERTSKKGKIGYAESPDGLNWEYRRTIIDEKFHLSYPNIIEWQGDHYIVPESHEDFSVRLYKATHFPEKWEYVGNLLSGYRYADPTPFHHDGTWWMFISTGHNNILNLYFSDRLDGGWQPHPMNPVVKFDKHHSRPGGRMLQHDGRLYRMAQDCEPYYGIQVFAIEITDLSKSSYAEDLAGKRIVVSKTGSGWNASGMHHADIHLYNDRWIAAVDGQY